MHPPTHSLSGLKVLDRATQQLVACTPKLCPFASANLVNFAPYSAEVRLKVFTMKRGARYWG